MREHSKPSSALLGELREVALASQALATHLRGDNTIPTSFPKAQLIMVAESLSALPTTTTASAMTVLEYASRRLPAVRREHLRHHSPAPESPDDVPEPTRGTILDQYLKDVIVAVGTALDECRREAAQPYEEQDEPLEHRVDALTDPEVEGLLKKSSELDQSAANAAGEIHAAKQPGSMRADDLERSIAGARTVNSAAAAELQMPSTVVPWLQRLARGMSKYPAAFRILGGALEKGTDIAAPAWNRWSRFWHEVGDALIRETGGFGKDLGTLADKWEAKQFRPADGVAQPANAEARFQALIDLSHDENEQTRRVAIRQLASQFATAPGTTERLRKVASDDPNNWVRKEAITLCGQMTHDPAMGAFLRDLHSKTSPWAPFAGDLLSAMLAFPSNRQHQSLMEGLRAKVRAPRNVPLYYKRSIMRAMAEFACEDAHTMEFLATLIDGNNQRLSQNAIQSSQRHLDQRVIQLATIRALERHDKHWEPLMYTVDGSLPYFLRDKEVAKMLYDLLHRRLKHPNLARIARRYLDTLTSAKADPQASKR